MKNWKKPIAAVLAGICCVVGMPQVQLVLPALQAAAAETADTGTVGTLTYTLESDRAVITQCDENAEEVVIPSEIEGKPAPSKSAKPDVYNPLKEVPNIVLDALNVGMLMMGCKPEAEVEKAVMEFITRYGLLGLMTALPTTPAFMDYEAVYLPKNHFLKEESMDTDR